jgi:tRNA(fMet)-specific endonuclease VapC
MTYLVDTDWIIHALKGQQRALTTLRRLAPQRIAVSIITVAEVYEVAFNTSNPQAHLENSRGFLSPFQVLPISDAVAEIFAETRAFLRRRGQPIGDFDTLIAATALLHNLTLLTDNMRHYERVPDLKTYKRTG